MRAPTAEINVELTPGHRLDLINISEKIAAQYGDVLAAFPRALYCSYHTTAGYFEQRLCDHLNHDPALLQAYLRTFREFFPPGAGYRHDQLQLRTELTEEQRSCEPRNADSHLTFIGSGLENCVAYRNDPQTPVFFVDLDGVNGETPRRRSSTVIGFNETRVVERRTITIPVSGHAIDSVNLGDARLGLFDALQEGIEQLEIDKGWVEVSLAPDEAHAGLTVNEYETLLMQYDLVEVLQNPLRFMAEKGRNVLHDVLRDPGVIPGKARNYAKYDLVLAMNRVLDALGLSGSLVERVIDRFMALPAARLLGMKRSVRLLISGGTDGPGHIVHGRYQSPILVQWRKADGRARRLQATFVRFE